MTGTRQEQGPQARNRTSTGTGTEQGQEQVQEQGQNKGRNKDRNKDRKPLQATAYITTSRTHQD